MVSTGIGKRYADGQAILCQGEPASRLYVVLTGEVELLRETEQGELPLVRLRSGAMFGELAIFDGELQPATARACGEVRVLTIDRRALLRRLKEDPTFGIRILQQLANRVRDLTSELATLKGR